MNTAERDQARAITDSASAYLSANAGPARARQFLNDGAVTLETSNWRGIAELGWLGIAVPESSGGLELGGHAACLVAEEAGRTLLMAPLTMAMAAAQLLSAGNESPATEALEALLAADIHVSLAASGAASGEDENVGRSFLVADGDLASLIVVASGSSEAFEGRLIAPGAPGVCVDSRPRVDSGSLGFATISATAWSNAPRAVHGISGQRAWNAALDLLRLADAAYLCGAAAATLTMGLDYLRLRRQFGVPIGSFQVLQHRAADCHIQLSATRALVYESTRAIDTPRSAFAAAASIRRATQTALQVTKENVQFHGAIGFADEHDAGLFLRRAMVLSAWHTAGAVTTLHASNNSR